MERIRKGAVVVAGTVVVSFSKHVRKFGRGGGDEI